MYDPSKILAWIVANAQRVRLSRCKTWVAIVSAVLRMKGIGARSPNRLNRMREGRHWVESLMYVSAFPILLKIVILSV